MPWPRARNQSKGSARIRSSEVDPGPSMPTFAWLWGARPRARTHQFLKEGRPVLKEGRPADSLDFVELARVMTNETPPPGSTSCEDSSACDTGPVRRHEPALHQGRSAPPAGSLVLGYD